jgi:bifunctional ADP-heptose synthase (sugar kinase/adenylyltransferase)
MLKLTTAPRAVARKGRIVVVGDVMVYHHFIYTTKDKRTRRAIVSFHHAHAEETIWEVVRTATEEGEAELPGGAARVAAVLSNLGYAVLLIGVVGADSRAKSLREQLAKYSDLEFYAIEDPGRPTTLKLRLFPGAPERSGSIPPTYRLDQESRSDIAKTAEISIIAKLTEALREGNVDAVVVEEYDKGVITEGIADWLRDPNSIDRTCVPLIVDPRFQWDKYRGVPISTVLSSFDEFRLSIPNIPSSAEAVVPSDEQLEAAIEKWPAINAWIITCEGEGEVVCYRNNPEDRI